MSTEPETRDAAAWARPVERLTASDGHINVTGRRPTGADPRLRPDVAEDLSHVARRARRAAAAGREPRWKAHFPEFWPSGNRFFAPLAGIAPGEVAALDLSMPGGLKLSTGVLVLYADDESFTLMTPQGHMFAGWITFSAYVEDGETYAQAQVLMRASDPLYELGMTLGGHGKEDEHWSHTLRALAHVPRCRGRGHDADRVRRPQAPVVAGGERLAERRDTLRHAP